MNRINIIELRDEDEDIILTTYKDKEAVDPGIPDGEFTAFQTDLNGEMIAPGKMVRLSNGCKIRMADEEFVFQES